LASDKDHVKSCDYDNFEWFGRCPMWVKSQAIQGHVGARYDAYEARILCANRMQGDEIVLNFKSFLFLRCTRHGGQAAALGEKSDHYRPVINARAFA
jgi:hypothetical protein